MLNIQNMVILGEIIKFFIHQIYDSRKLNVSNITNNYG